MPQARRNSRRLLAFEFEIGLFPAVLDEAKQKGIDIAPKNVGVEGQLPGAVGTNELVEFEERWTGSYIFENEWQSFRTSRDRSLDLTSAPYVYEEPGTYVIAVKVIDIFGNDTMKLVAINVA